ncbi:hypothetical protein ACPV4H_01770 [Vibrio rotiferianus]|uniref:hypothetical protein n=1 Tax=Vibrio rotiferianus TaxID=190895 RepID=UPI00406A1887
MSFWGVLLAIFAQFIALGIWGLFLLTSCSSNTEKTYRTTERQRLFFELNLCGFFISFFTSLGLLVYGLIFSNSSHYYAYLAIPWLFVLTGLCYDRYCQRRYGYLINANFQAWQKYWHKELDKLENEELPKYRYDDVVVFDIWQACPNKQASCIAALPKGQELYSKIENAKEFAKSSVSVSVSVSVDDQTVLDKLKEFENAVSKVHQTFLNTPDFLGFNGQGSHTVRQKIYKGYKKSYPNLYDETQFILFKLQQITRTTIINNFDVQIEDAYFFLQYSLDGLFEEKDIFTNYVLWTYVEEYYDVNPFQLAIELSQMGVKIVKNTNEYFVFIE